MDEGKKFSASLQCILADYVTIFQDYLSTLSEATGTIHVPTE